MCVITSDSEKPLERFCTYVAEKFKNMATKTSKYASNTLHLVLELY